VINKSQAFADAFPTSAAQTFAIENTTEAAFQLLMQWLYTGEIEVMQT
jgi:hypothetical protein